MITSFGRLTSITTNKPHIRTNATILTKLIKESKMTIADGAVAFFLTTIASSESIHLIRNTNRQIERNLSRREGVIGQDSGSLKKFA